MKSCAKLQKIIHITKLNFKIMKTLKKFVSENQTEISLVENEKRNWQVRIQFANKNKLLETYYNYLKALNSFFEHINFYRYE